MVAVGLVVMTVITVVISGGGGWVGWDDLR